MELLYLIFIRATFKEFSHITNFNGEEMTAPVINMICYSFGALLIFGILGFTYKLQFHTPLTKTEDDVKEFVQSKKTTRFVLACSFCSYWFFRS